MPAINETAPDVGALLSGLLGQFLQNQSFGEGDGAQLVQTLLSSPEAVPQLTQMAGMLVDQLPDDDEQDDEEGEAFAEIDQLLADFDDDRPRQNRDDAEDDELSSLRDVNDTLASALGACCVCWGGDENCETCKGSGECGSQEPDQALFAELILPAVRRMRKVSE